MIVFKYKLPSSAMHVQMRPGKIIHTDIDGNDDPCIWVLCDEDAALTSRRMVIVGTGQALPEHGDWQHVGSINDNNGRFFWHVFMDGAL